MHTLSYSTSPHSIPSPYSTSPFHAYPRPILSHPPMNTLPLFYLNMHTLSLILPQSHASPRPNLRHSHEYPLPVLPHPPCTPSPYSTSPQAYPSIPLLLLHLFYLTPPRIPSSYSTCMPSPYSASPSCIPPPPPLILPYPLCIPSQLDFCLCSCT